MRPPTNGQAGLATETPFPGSYLADFAPLGPQSAPHAHFPYRQGLDGRLFTDLSILTADRLCCPTADFFIRTRASAWLPPATSWQVQVGSVSLPVSWFSSRREPLGEILMECSGNTAHGGHRLLSSAAWEGVPVTRVLEELKTPRLSSHVLVSGFDEYPERSHTKPPSEPGADWIFSLDRWLEAAPALVTHLNGVPLTRDHGAPIRLLVPNWYGCCCIKWVTRLQFVRDDVATTPHMRWFAGRTHQEGVPAKVTEYQDPVIRPAAMPVRVERWVRKDLSMYRVVGIVWGTPRPPALSIRFGKNGAFKPVHLYEPPVDDRSWSLWYHCFRPVHAGTYSIQLQTDPPVSNCRLDHGYYRRYVTIEHPTVASAVV